jgi:hypothetical protein
MRRPRSWPRRGRPWGRRCASTRRRWGPSTPGGHCVRKRWGASTWPRRPCLSRPRGFSVSTPATGPSTTPNPSATWGRRTSGWVTTRALSPCSAGPWSCSKISPESAGVTTRLPCRGWDGSTWN